MQKQAKITKEQSTSIATAQVQGTVKDVQLEDENGTAIYNVQIQDSKGQITEVKVDAATGKITKQEQADNKQEGQDQAGASVDVPEAGDTPDAATGAAVNAPTTGAAVDAPEAGDTQDTPASSNTASATN